MKFFVTIFTIVLLSCTDRHRIISAEKKILLDSLTAINQQLVVRKLEVEYRVIDSLERRVRKYGDSVVLVSELRRRALEIECNKDKLVEPTKSLLKAQATLTHRIDSLDEEDEKY